MRSYLPDFSVINPKTLSEALEVMASQENVIPIAGGTDIMVYMEAGKFPACTLLNMLSIKDIRREPVLEGGRLIIGPLTTYHDVRRNTEIIEKFPMLYKAAREVGVLAIQNRGTWVGNIVNASPAADGVPALMVYDAQLELNSVRGTRTVPLADFYKGYKQMDREQDELVTAIYLPVADESQWKEYYRKVGTRRFQAISKTLLAARVRVEGDTIADIRLAFASVAPYTLRARETEQVLRGSKLSEKIKNTVLETLSSEISPIDDIRSNREYRTRVSCNLIKDMLSAIS